MFSIFKHKPSFDEQYPELSRFLAHFDPEFFFLDYDSEQEGIEEMVSGNEEYWTVLQQGREILALEKFPWQSIVNARHFWLNNPDEAHTWFTNIITLLEAQLRRTEHT